MVWTLGFKGRRSEWSEILPGDRVFRESELSFQRCHSRGDERSIKGLWNVMVILDMLLKTR